MGLSPDFPVIPVYNNPETSCIALAVMAAGIPVYFGLVKRSPTWLSAGIYKLTLIVQKISMSVPETLDDDDTEDSKFEMRRPSELSTRSAGGQENAAYEE